MTNSIVPHPHPSDPKFINMAGKSYGLWTVICYAGNKKWHAKCACGVVKIVNGSLLRRGTSTKCKSCANRKHANPMSTHGLSQMPIYGVWHQMMQRCHNPNHAAFDRYGGRGIVVAKRWHNVRNFYADMGERPKNRTLDRIDNNGPYSPENCRWATNRQQSLNTRQNRYLTHNGVSKTIVEWCEETGIGRGTLTSRIDRYGWSVEKALSTPARAIRRK